MHGSNNRALKELSKGYDRGIPAPSGYWHMGGCNHGGFTNGKIAIN